MSLAAAAVSLINTALIASHSTGSSSRRAPAADIAEPEVPLHRNAKADPNRWYRNTTPKPDTMPAPENGYGATLDMMAAEGRLNLPATPPGSPAGGFYPAWGTPGYPGGPLGLRPGAGQQNALLPNGRVLLNGAIYEWAEMKSGKGAWVVCTEEEE